MRARTSPRSADCSASSRSCGFPPLGAPSLPSPFWPPAREGAIFIGGAWTYSDLRRCRHRRVRGHSNLVSISNLLVRTCEVNGSTDTADVTNCYIITDLMSALALHLISMPARRGTARLAPAERARVPVSAQVDGPCQDARLGPEVLASACALPHVPVPPRPTPPRALPCRAPRYQAGCPTVPQLPLASASALAEPDVARAPAQGNLLVDELWHLKVCDLGIARSAVNFDLTQPLDALDARFTDYVVTRPYRAPELLMGSQNYTAAVDMWAAGCIFAELLAAQRPKENAPLVRQAQSGLLRLPLFPGLDHRDMVNRIVGVLGHPSETTLDLLTLWEPRARAFVEKQPHRVCDLATRQEACAVEGAPPFCSTELATSDRVDWAVVFPWVDEDALDLLDAMVLRPPYAPHTGRRAAPAQSLEGMARD
jgi:hypothetical protein